MKSYLSCCVNCFVNSPLVEKPCIKMNNKSNRLLTKMYKMFIRFGRVKIDEI